MTVSKGYVLIVDDDRSIREALRLALEDEGYTVEEARDGIEAIEAMRQSTHQQVVLLDYRMPRMDGAGVIATALHDDHMFTYNAFMLITANLPSLPPTFVSLLDRLHVRIISKPFDMDDLLENVAITVRSLIPDDPSSSSTMLNIPH